MTHGGARNGAGRKPLQINVKRIKAMRADGWKVREIAEELSLKQGSIYKALRAAQQTEGSP